MTGNKIPTDHKKIIDGLPFVEGYHGYFRLFGFSGDMNTDLELWNTENNWKMAWEKDLSDYICFGATALGDQYAYSKTRLRNGDETVFFLDAYEMHCDVLAHSFEDFYQKEFLRCSEKPYDTGILNLYNNNGNVLSDEMIQYVPHFILGGKNPADIYRMKSRAAMIINADFFQQYSRIQAGQIIERVETVQDQDGNSRIKLIVN